MAALELDHRAVPLDPLPAIILEASAKKNLRQNPDKSTPPSIMITGHGEVSMAVKAMRAGAADFIEKPFGHEELIVSITHALEQVPGAARSEEA
jgi:FixJ family two-component response regulator